MTQLTEYKSGPSWGLETGRSISVVDGATGQAGAALTEDVKLLADRALVYHATAAPSPGDDQDDGFRAGSRWLDTATGRFYVCADSTSGAAVWKELGGSSFPAGLRVPADNAGLFFGEGNDASIRYDGTNLVVNPKETGGGSLSVAGNVEAANLRTAQYSSTIVGVNAGPVNAGDNNTFLGYGSGYANTTGADNLFAGRYSGFSNTTGTQNVFLGPKAGYLNTTGGSNMFVGFSAGYANTTGAGNVFIGGYAGDANTTGSNITCIGYEAGTEHTTGVSNCFIGSAAGRNTTTGSANMFLGTQAGYSNQVGGYNAFIGSAAGYFNTASHNTAIGYRAAYNNTSGSMNVAIGDQAGYSNQTGAGNVFLGYKAGYNETGSNRLYIDNSDTATPLIWGDFDNDLMNFNGRVFFQGVTTDVTPSNGLFTFWVDQANDRLVVKVAYADGTTKTGSIALS